MLFYVFEFSAQGRVSPPCEGKNWWNRRCLAWQVRNSLWKLFCLGLNSDSAPTSFVTLGLLPNLSKVHFPSLRNEDEIRVRVIELLRSLNVYCQSKAWLSAQRIINTCEASPIAVTLRCPCCAMIMDFTFSELHF